MIQKTDQPTNSFSSIRTQLDEQLQKDLSSPGISLRDRNRILRTHRVATSRLEASEAQVLNSSANTPSEEIVEIARCFWYQRQLGRDITLWHVLFAKSLCDKEEMFFEGDLANENKLVESFPQVAVTNLMRFIEERHYASGRTDDPSVEVHEFCQGRSRREIHAVIQDLEVLIGRTAGLSNNSVRRIMTEKLAIPELPATMLEWLRWFLYEREHMAKPRKQVRL